MSWFAPTRALRSLIGALLFALLVWLITGAVQGIQSKATGLNDFRISSFIADYALGRAGDGQGEVRVTETISVDFPEDNGNHGIFRTLPTSYSGRATPVTLESVTLDGERVPTLSTNEPTTITLRIGDESTTVSGRHTYRLTYRYTGVIQTFGDHQEFYWDVNGVNWPQAMGSVSATLTVPAELAPSLTGLTRCYHGAFGSTATCFIIQTDAPGGGVRIATEPVSVGGHGNQTLAVGFVAGTFADPPLADNTRTGIAVGGGIAGVLALLTIALAVVAATRRRRAMGYDPGVVQFGPREDLPPVIAAALTGRPGRGIIAELMRAASERHVQLAGGVDGTPLTATLVTWPEAWSSASKVALRAVFGEVDPDRPVDVKERLARIGSGRTAELRDAAVNRNLVRVPDVQATTVALIFANILAPVVIIVSGRALSLPFWWIVIPVLVSAVSLAVLYGLLMRWQSLTASGKEAFRYLNGLRMFLEASEAERMKVVQGADTSLRVGEHQLISIFEKLLPYAIALGLEDSWQKAVGTELELKFEGLPVGGLPTLTHTYAHSPSLERYWARDNSEEATIGGTFGDWGSAVSGRIASLGTALNSGSDSGGSSGWRSSSRRGGSSGGGFSGGGGGGGGGGGW